MNTENPTFDDLRFMYGTGRGYIISGTGRNKSTGYRQGVMCKLGDLDQAEWMRLMQELIDRAGEQMLYQQLLKWYTEHNYTKNTPAALELEALQAHSHRLFDCERWVFFVEFNKRFRPEVLKHADLVIVQCDCYSVPGITTQALLNQSNGTTCCPVCKRWSPYQRIETLKEVNTNDHL